MEEHHGALEGAHALRKHGSTISMPLSGRRPFFWIPIVAVLGALPLSPLYAQKFGTVNPASLSL